MLREYQQRSIDQLYEWMRSNQGHPCLELPTGSGKSWVIAALCKSALESWPETRILMLTHVKELIEQNAEKMRLHWPNAPLGIYSAGMGKRELGHPITFGSVQSLRGRADLLGRQDLVVIDECHLLNNEEQGTYRQLIADLMEENSYLRVIGLTATPYRLGQGLITDGDDALFSDIITPTSIEELIFHGHLAPLRSKVTGLKYDTSQVKKRGGEFAEGDLARAVDTEGQNDEVVREIISIAGDRKAWLLFCTGVAHSLHMRDILREYGVEAETITGDTPKAQREEIIRRFKAGEIRALTNANVLCLSEDTEILTSSGFVGIDEMSMDHQLAAWREDGGIEYGPPALITRRPAGPDEKIVFSDGNAAQFSVTGNHRMVVRCGHGSSGTKVVQAENLVGSHFFIPTFGEAESTPCDLVPQPLIDRKRFVATNSYTYRAAGMSPQAAKRKAELFYERKRRLSRQLEPNELSLDMCRFIGFWLGDGTRSGNRVSIAQSERYMDNVEWIRSVSMAAGLHFTEARYPASGKKTAESITFSYCWGTGGDSQLVDTKLKSVDYWLNKDGVSQLRGLSRGQLEAFLDGYWRADGNHHTKNNKAKQITSTRPQLLGLIQECCSARGISATVVKLGAPRKKSHSQQYALRFGGRQSWCYSPKNVKTRGPKPGERVWCVTSSTSYIICRRNGKVFVTGNTTGFDHPDIDLIAMCRPTVSAALYYQMAGRGLRPKSHTDHCLVLDFAGVVSLHGPVTHIEPPTARGGKPGESPVKVCDNCDELVHMSARVCPSCGYQFVGDESKTDLHLRNDDIMELEIPEMEVESWLWRKHVSRNSGMEMLRVDYYGRELDDPVISEYLCVRHEGYPYNKAVKELGEIERARGTVVRAGDDIEESALLLNSTPPPTSLAYKRDGKFWRVLSKVWGEREPEPELDFDDDPIPF